MSPQPNPNPLRPLVFGPFAFDEASGELRKHGSRVRLQGQPLRILADLVREPGRTITREEFQQRLWNGSTFVDFEHGLNAAMNRLRQVLGDTADNPRYIETLPGRGYRFIAAVQPAAPNPVLVMAAAPVAVVDPAIPDPPASPQENRPWLRWVVAALILLAVAGGAFWVGHRPSTGSLAQPLRFGISPPDGFALESGSSRQTFALSPDGSRLAFTAMDASGRFQMFIRDLNRLDPRPLPNSLGSYHVFWAPDSRSLFLTVGDKLRRSSLVDDSSQVICDTPAIMLTGALKSPNLLISGRVSNFVVTESGGSPKMVKELYPWPQFLPDGKHLLYTAFDSQSGHHHARVVKYGEPASSRDLIETDSRVQYTPSVLNPQTGYLVYIRAGNILAQEFDPRALQVKGEPRAVVAQTYSFNPTGAADFSVSNNGILAYRRYQSRSQLAWVDRRGEVLRRLGPDRINLKLARLSPDGSKVATPVFDVTRGVNDMWIIDTETGAARRAIVGRGLVDNPVWSPDSKRLAYSRAYDTPPKLFIRGLGEHDTDEVMPENFFQVPSDWSRDGRFIAFTNTSIAAVDNELKGDVWLIDLQRNRKIIHLIETPFHEANPAFSPDGRWLAFMSNESGQGEVYVQAFEAGDAPRLVGERFLLTKHGATALRWARDGKELFYLAWDGKLYSVPITLAPKPHAGEPVPLFAISMEARAALHSPLGFDVSPDGQRLLVPIVTSAEKSEIVVIQNWEAGGGR